MPCAGSSSSPGEARETGHPVGEARACRPRGSVPQTCESRGPGDVQRRVGRRHLDHDQEEVFVPLRGTLTMLLGEPWERVDVEPGGVVVVHAGTPLQMRNETDEEILAFVYGAPARHGNAEFLEDVESL